MYALVGNFGFAPGPKGIGVYRYNPATAQMKWIETVFEEVNVGHQSIDEERGIIYIVNECPSQRGQTGGGGYVLALQINPQSGRLSLLNEKPTLSQEPCYICLDITKRYLIVSHHADFGFVTKVVKGENGYSTQVIFDDTALVLFRINDDGSLGDVCDVSVMTGEGAASPHPTARHHSVVMNPSGELIIVPDKGLEKFHTYHLDRADGKLVQLQTTVVEPGLIPRYGVFHPTLPIFYANFEKKAIVNAYQYDAAKGELELIHSVPSLVGDKAAENKAEPADILIHPNGKTLYVSIRGTNTISVLDVDAAGAIALRDVIDCGGVNPRGLYISPDTRFLFAANMNSGNVAAFTIEPDGTVCATGTGVKAGSPGSIRIITV